MKWKNKRGEKVEASQIDYEYLENALAYFVKQRQKFIDQDPDTMKIWKGKETERLLRISSIIGDIKVELKRRDDELDKFIENTYGKTMF